MRHDACDHDTFALLELLYGELDDARRVAAERHVARCSRCAVELDELRATADALDVWESPGTSTAESAAVAAVALAAARRAPRRARRWPLVAAAAAVALLFALGARVEVGDGRLALLLRLPWADAPEAVAALDETAVRRVTEERVAEMAAGLRADQLQLVRDVALREREERRQLALVLGQARERDQRAVRDALDRLARGADRQTRRTHEALLEVASAVAVQIPTDPNEVNR